MAKILKQVIMVFDLNKCLGCHTCTMACKTMWTDRNAGQMYMYWNNVESQPGRGYPKDWQTLGGGFSGCGRTAASTAPFPSIDADYGPAWEYNFDEVLASSKEDRPSGSFPVGGEFIPSAAQVLPYPNPNIPTSYSSNWDEDVGDGVHPDSYYFYLPRICNHCSKPACVAACPRKAVYKRKEDGIVLIDQNRCRGYRYCGKGCPYKKIYWSPQQEVSQKCIFCYPRLQDPNAVRKNFCVAQCAGRIRWVGYDDGVSNASKLAHGSDGWPGVALRLHPEFGTGPNTFYIPPLSPPAIIGSRKGPTAGEPRIPIDLLAGMFGDTCDIDPATGAIPTADRIVRIQEIFDTLIIERAKGKASSLMKILTAYSEADRIQL